MQATVQDTIRSIGSRRPAHRAPPRATTASIEIDTSSYQLARGGLRFAQPETEAAYRLWHAHRSVPLARTGMIAALVTWSVVLGVGPFLVAFRAYAVIAAMFAAFILPAFVFAIATTREHRVRSMLPAQLIANVVTGVVFTVMSFWIVDRPELGLVGVITGALYAFTVQPLRVSQALVSSSSYLVLNQVFAIAWLVTGRLDHFAFAIDSIVPINTVVTGVLARAASERASRRAFRDEQIISQQRAAIDRERARASVAERARELSEALLRLSGAPGRAQRFEAGAIVRGRYRVLRPIGRGGMGQVYEVERLDDGEALALKVMTGTADRLALARFAREAQLAAELRHPNVVGAVDIGVTDEGTLYLVMDLVPGRALAELRDHYGDPSWALPVLRDIATALGAMHERGIVHRDLKPANVLVAEDGAKVTDFGIAALRARDTDPVSAHDDTAAAVRDLTQTGAILGTPMYMAPELAAGAEHACAASDVFSFGVVAFELLGGALPFDVPPVYARPAPPPLASRCPHVRPEVCTLVDRCLAIDPAARPTAAALASALAA
ncbi:MAG TPA: serine/threonine-protein kinase [Kofleriaceae bacterium]|nr:serine/threonine-protein kinase [Kofleriaceae bacterium]